MSQQHKRFWKMVSLEQRGALYGPALDGRPVHLPAGHRLEVETRALAEAIVAEWAAIGPGEHFGPEALSFTRIAGTLIERIIPQREAACEALVAHGMDDALCYRSPAQDKVLIERIFAWAAQHGLYPQVTGMIMPLAQPELYREVLLALLMKQNNACLAALGVLVPLMSSLLLPLALLYGVVNEEEAFSLGFADERYQLEVWGHDDGLALMLRQRDQDMRDALEFYRLAQHCVA